MTLRFQPTRLNLSIVEINITDINYSNYKKSYNIHGCFYPRIIDNRRKNFPIIIIMVSHRTKFEKKMDDYNSLKTEFSDLVVLLALLISTNIILIKLTVIPLINKFERKINFRRCFLVLFSIFDVDA